MNHAFMPLVANLHTNSKHNALPITPRKKKKRKIQLQLMTKAQNQRLKQLMEERSIK